MLWNRKVFSNSEITNLEARVENDWFFGIEYYRFSMIGEVNSVPLQLSDPCWFSCLHLSFVVWKSKSNVGCFRSLSSPKHNPFLSISILVWGVRSATQTLCYSTKWNISIIMLDHVIASSFRLLCVYVFALSLSQLGLPIHKLREGGRRNAHL